MYFYKPTKDERADQPPPGMVANNEYVLEVGLHLLLNVAISHLLVTMNLLGQARLFWLPTPAELNYLMYPIPQIDGYHALRLKKDR